MVKLCKTWKPTPPANRDARFTRRKPGYNEPLHSESPLQLIRARYYHAQLGRFISRDPLGYVNGMSLYRAYFVPGGVDPNGLWKCKCVCSAAPGVIYHDETTDIDSNLLEHQARLRCDKHCSIPWLLRWGYRCKGTLEYSGTIVQVDQIAVVPLYQNTVVCEKEKLVVQIGSPEKADECTTVHEEKHIVDYKRRFGPCPCKGVPDGRVPYRGDAWEDFLEKSECEAHLIAYKCRWDMLKNGTAKDREKTKRKLILTRGLINKYCKNWLPRLDPETLGMPDSHWPSKR